MCVREANRNTKKKRVEVENRQDETGECAPYFIQLHCVLLLRFCLAELFVA